MPLTESHYVPKLPVPGNYHSILFLRTCLFKILYIHGIIKFLVLHLGNFTLKKQENSRETSTFASLTMLKPLTVWITTNCGKFFKRWEYQTTLPASWETCMQVKKQQLELEMEQWTGSKLEKEYIKAVYCHLAYLNASLDEAQAGIKISRRSINNLRYADDTTLLAENEEELKSLFMKVKGEWKSWLKTQHSRNKYYGIWSHHFMANREGNKWWQPLFSWAPKSL